MKNYPIKIETGEHAGETVWVHRSIAVAGFVFCKIDGEWCVLANQRGEGAPDFKGYWNCPCGYLDFDETTKEACIREIYEETGVKVDPKNIKVTDKLSSWSTEPLRRYYIDDCVKYIGKDTENLQYGDLLCVYAMNYSKHELQCIKLSDYNIYTISISDCVLHSTCYPLRKGTRVVVSMVSHYTQKGKAGFILETDYRTCLPYCVKWDDGSTSWVIGCTVTTETPEDSIIEESEEDIEIDFISENGFFKEVTFYERN